MMMMMTDINKDNVDYIPNYTGPSYTDLPMEIILHIMNYLHPTDIKIASQTCRRWFEAAQYPEYSKKQSLHFFRCSLSDERDGGPLEPYLHSMRNYTKIILDHVEFGTINTEFWDRFSDSIEALTFRNCDLRERNLKSILLHLNGLRHLEIENCRELFMSGRLFESDKQAICAACRDVESLALINNRYLSDALFNRFVTIMPRLHTIDLSGCHISFHKGLYKKFYPDSQKEPSESVLTFHYISQFIECESETLKSFNFSYTLIDGSALQTLGDIKQLKLTTILLRSCDQLTNSGIISLAQSQTSLQHLDLSCSVRLTDPGLIEICRCLTELKVLKLRRCRALTDIGVKEIIQLKNLTCLDISECESITSRGIVEGIALQRNERLRALYVSALNICQMAVIRIAEHFPELRVLDLSFCKNGVTDLAVQWICKHLQWLRVLNLEYCDKISDAALTGIDMMEQIDKFLNIKLKDTNEINAINEALGENNINENEDDLVEPQPPPPIIVQPQPQQHLPIEPYKISLRSKAENEIVNDAKRKKMMIEMYEKQSHKSPIDYSGYCISQIRGLRLLNLNSCNRITDVSLKYSFRLNELKELSIAKCQQITSDGMLNVIKYCPSLEVVNLSECHNISDKTIEIITIHLYRLTHLYLERCTQLTDHSLDYIAINCLNLRYLDVRGCRSMCSEPSLRLTSLPSLKHVSMSKPGPYVIDNVPTYAQNVPKSPPLPPLGF